MALSALRRRRARPDRRPREDPRTDLERARRGASYSRPAEAFGVSDIRRPGFVRLARSGNGPGNPPVASISGEEIARIGCVTRRVRWVAAATTHENEGTAHMPPDEQPSQEKGVVVGGSLEDVVEAVSEAARRAQQLVDAQGGSPLHGGPPLTGPGTSLHQPTDGASVRISAPWGEGQYFDPGPMQAVVQQQATNDFLRIRSELHRTYIVEQEKTKRLGLLVACALLIVGAAVVIFAPDGRDAVANWMGGALVVAAAGAVGFSRVHAKSPLFEVGAGTSHATPKADAADAASNGSPDGS